MTYSNGQFNPHPLANPFNTRLGPANFTCPNPLRSNVHTPSKGINTRNLEVPNQDVPMYGTLEWEERYGKSETSNLQVPNQDVPPGDQLNGNGFLIGSDRLFRCQDGTILDWKSGKIIRSGQNSLSKEYWGDPNQMISFNLQDDPGSLQGDLGDQNLVNNQDATPLSDKDSAIYWLKAEEEAEKLKNSMTQAQLQAIADFEAHFPKSRLIEESKKLEKGH